MGELDITDADAISPEYVKRFCQNSQYCEVFRCRTVAEEFRPLSVEDGGIDIACECEDEDSLIQWYIALRAADRFCEEHGHAPGALCGDRDDLQLTAECAALANC